MRWFLAAGLLALGLAAVGLPALALENRPLPQVPALLFADRVSYDDELGVVVANGHVEISQNDRVVQADTVTYNQRTNLITASGNVSMLEPGGDVFFANYMELSQDLRNAVAQDFRMLMRDKSRYAAAGARRENATLTEMANGVFTPCDLCKDDPESPPEWQIKAKRIVHDADAHEVVYQDATMEMWGVPIAWTPYYSYPDPTVKRKSGLLAPVFGENTQLGFIAKTPYFWDISPDKDLTLDPIFLSKEVPVANGEYRERWDNARIDLAGSLTDPSAFDENGNPKPGNQLRGHLTGSGVLDIDEDWRTGFAVQRETNQTYLQRYKIVYTPPTVLTSNAFLEGFYGRSYNALNSYAFQDTRQQVNLHDLPIVAPIYSLNYVGEPGAWGQHWSVDANAMNLFRPNGEATRRVSQRTLWELPYTSPLGDHYALSVALQSDGYSSNSSLDPNTPTALGSYKTPWRVLPQTKLDWRYPWVREDGDLREVIEPRVAFIAGTRAQNRRIPDEDSTDFELDDENLYRLNPFPGVDRVAGGERAVYGSSFSVYAPHGGQTSLFLGEMYQLRRDASTFAADSGLAANLSDVVGRLQIKPLSFIDFNYRFRLAQKTLAPERTEISLGSTIAFLNLNMTYVDLTQNVAGVGLTHLREAGPSIGAQVFDHWRISLNAVRDLQLNQFRSYGGTLAYTDECLTVLINAGRNFATTSDVQPSNTYLITLVFKDLGDVSFGGTTATAATH